MSNLLPYHVPIMILILFVGIYFALQVAIIFFEDFYYNLREVIQQWKDGRND